MNITDTVLAWQRMRLEAFQAIGCFHWSLIVLFVFIGGSFLIWQAQP